MCQSPSRDCTPARTSLNASLSEGVPSSSSAPRRRQFRQSPLVSRETEWHCSQTSVSPTTANVESVGGALMEVLLRIGAQARAQIADFVIDVRLGFHGLGDFLAQQRPVTRAKPVEQSFHGQLWNAQRLRE